MLVMIDVQYNDKKQNIGVKQKLGQVSRLGNTVVSRFLHPLIQLLNLDIFHSDFASIGSTSWDSKALIALCYCIHLLNSSILWFIEIVSLFSQPIYLTIRAI